MPQAKLVGTVLSFVSMLFVSAALQADQNDTHKTVGGNYFVLPDLTRNRITVQVQRPGKDPVKADFQYSTGQE